MLGEINFLLSRVWVVVLLLMIFNFFGILLLLLKDRKISLKSHLLIFINICVVQFLAGQLIIGLLHNQQSFFFQITSIFIYIPFFLIGIIIRFLVESQVLNSVNNTFYYLLLYLAYIFSAISAGAILGTLIFKIEKVLFAYFKKFKNLKLDYKQTIYFSMYGLFVGSLIAVSSTVLTEYCRPSWHNFHIFNAHLKDVCSEEKWSEQCPRALSDLRNFDPPHFDEMNKCSRVFYFFDEQGKGSLIVNQGNQVLVSDDRMHDRFGYYLLSSPNQNASTMIQSVPSYPPKMESNWPNLSFWR